MMLIFYYIQFVILCVCVYVCVCVCTCHRESVEVRRQYTGLHYHLPWGSLSPALGVIVTCPGGHCHLPWGSLSPALGVTGIKLRSSGLAIDALVYWPISSAILFFIIFIYFNGIFYTLLLSLNSSYQYSTFILKYYKT
jgi:hypothetical protein